MVTKEQTEAIYQWLKSSKKPIKRDTLARLLLFNPVKVRQAADELLKRGIPCVTDYKEGFRIAKTAEEFDEEIRRNTRMAKTILRKVKRLKNLRETHVKDLIL